MLLIGYLKKKKAKQKYFLKICNLDKGKNQGAGREKVRFGDNTTKEGEK